VSALYRCVLSPLQSDVASFLLYLLRYLTLGTRVPGTVCIPQTERSEPMKDPRDAGAVPLCSDDECLLPPYTLRERSRELRQRSVMLCWRAQRLRTRSMLLLHK
jgi:hypothetical protein